MIIHNADFIHGLNPAQAMEARFLVTHERGGHLTLEGRNKLAFLRRIGDGELRLRLRVGP